MQEPKDFPKDADRSDIFTFLIREYGEKAYNFAYRLTGNEPDARDLMQEAFARVLKHRQKYDPSRRFDAWLYRILHNIYLDSVRRYAHKHTVSLDAPTPVEGTHWDEIISSGEQQPVDAMIEKETDDLVQKALDSLPIAYKTAVVLSDVDGVSYERISEIMSCPIGTVRSRIHQGRLLLRKAFDRLQKGGFAGERKEKLR